MANPNSVPIRFYLEFWSRDFPSFPYLVQAHLGDFLEELQSNPTSPRLLAKCQQARYRKDRFVYFFCDAHAVYWRLIRQAPTYFTELDSEKVIRIDVLEARKVAH